MQDAPAGMRRLLPEGKHPVRVAVELDSSGLDQDFLQQLRALLGQDLGGLGQGGACAGGQDVLHQQVGAVVGAARDDPALGVARV